MRAALGNPFGAQKIARPPKRRRGRIVMQAFINLVKVQAEKKLIPTSVAADLTADAVRIRAVIGCP